MNFSTSRLRTMRTAAVAAPGRVTILHQAIPEPGPAQVRVRLQGCGVCASNQPVWEGRPWFRYPQEPGAPGHEGWGHIDATGSEVRGLEIGTRVAMVSSHAFAEYDIADCAAVVPLPSAFNDAPFPGEPLGCAMNVFRRSGVTAKHTVAVIGAGFMGVLLIQLFSTTGARVIAISRRPSALAIARRCGAAETVVDDGGDVEAAVLAMTSGRGCERVIEAAGTQRTLDLASNTVSEGGRLIIAGYHQDGLRQVNMQLWNWRGVDVINAHERNPLTYAEGMRLAIQAVLDGRMDPFPLLTHAYPLHALDDAFKLFRQRPNGFLKAVVAI